jgi:hypothetical protein
MALLIRIMFLIKAIYLYKKQSNLIKIISNFKTNTTCKGACSLVVAVTLVAPQVLGVWVRIPVRANFRLGKKKLLLVPLYGMGELTCGGGPSCKGLVVG